MTTEYPRPDPPAGIRERIAYELVKRRRFRPAEWLIWAAACVLVVWGFLVCVVTISAVLIAIVESWIS